MKQRFYLYAFTDEFGPLFALYVLWFSDAGLSTSQMSGVFGLWALIGLLALRSALPVLLWLGCGASLVGLFLGPWWMVALLGVGYAAHDVAWIVSDARMQEHAPSATRATVISVRALLSNTVSMLAFGIVAAFSTRGDPTHGVAAIVLGLGVTALLVKFWVPQRAP